jgi:hypothetical protein
VYFRTHPNHFQNRHQQQQSSSRGHPQQQQHGNFYPLSSSSAQQNKSLMRSSHSSDSSSAYSGSDTMQSVPSSVEAAGASAGAEVDLSGLMESVVDSDEDEEDEVRIDEI